VQIEKQHNRLVALELDSYRFVEPMIVGHDKPPDGGSSLSIPED
jgi:hypothetical protein